jgi:hypothetical protein
MKQRLIELYKDTIDLDIKDTEKVLRESPMANKEDGGCEVFYGGKWLFLGRTDLKDDVGTWNDDMRVDTFRNMKVGFGARIRSGSFNVIDNYSDG